jgi:hypothetical protein
MSLDSATPGQLAPSRASRGAMLGNLRGVAIAAGIGWSLAFIVVGARYGLQLYGDGAIFSYAVAIEEGWAVHWHNIVGRTAVYLLTLAPAQAYVRLTQDAAGGVMLYGLLFSSAQLLGLLATYALDRSAGRVMFSFACASTACLCPLVFGFPTEMWMAHALFWPTLALCHYGRGGMTGFIAVALSMLALLFTHEGAVVLAVAILMTLVLRGYRDPAFQRAAAALTAVLAIWVTVKAMVVPDDYIAPVLAAAKYNFFDPDTFIHGLFGRLAVALAAYGSLSIMLQRLSREHAHVYSGLIVVAGMTAYWLLVDPPLHTENRYLLRTALMMATPCFGALAVLYVLAAELRLPAPIAPLLRLLTWLRRPDVVRAGAGAILLLALVNAVETARFVTAWTDYKSAVRKLAMGAASDPQLGDPRFVSLDRTPMSLRPLSWSSTTPFLSVMVAPNFKPARLVVDPTADYFWLSCRFAHDNEAATRAIPLASRALIRAHACLHR